MSDQDLREYHERIRRQEEHEHQDAVLAVAAIIKTPEGEKLFRYLFKSFEVGNLPDRSIVGDDLHEYLGFLRAGNSIYKLTCEGDHRIAAAILSKLERERYEHIYHEQRLRNGLNDTNY